MHSPISASPHFHLIKGAFNYLLESRSQRIRLLSTLYVKNHLEYCGRREYVLPDDTPEAVLMLCRQKADILGVGTAADEEGLSLDRRVEFSMDIVGFRVAPPRETCCKSLRAQRLSVSGGSVCKLLTTITGGVGVEGAWTISNKTTYGLTAAASQVWSVKHLPDIPAWTIGDRYGAVGVLLGHRSYPSYIIDTSKRWEMSTRVTNGPVALFYDECTGS